MSAENVVSHESRKATKKYIRSSNKLFKFLDAILTAPLRPEQSLIEYVKRIFARKSPNFERTAFVSKFFNKLIPGFAQGLSRSLSNTHKLPFKLARAELYNFGSGSTVFLIHDDGNPKVLKIYRKSLGKKVSSLLDVTRFFQNKYQTVHDWYNEKYEIVPSTCYLILHGVIFGKAAVGAIQDFIQGEVADLFQDYTDSELIQLFERDADLRDQFVFFAKKTISVFENENRCADFIGKDNVMIVQEGDRGKLLLIDFGIFDLDLLQIKKPLIYEQTLQRIKRLKKLLRALTQVHV